jgi:hypothetical protein
MCVGFTALAPCLASIIANTPMWHKANVEVCGTSTHHARQSAAADPTYMWPHPSVPIDEVIAVSISLLQWTISKKAVEFHHVGHITEDS